MAASADRAAQPTPRLTRLDLHGFKSFATKTTLVFEPGITAVVGPNGSGKSNISDAIRWVLGETSHSALRSKKTEDVIFAGGRGKSPSGMAEVTVTFNNEDRWLDSEFVEVTVTRRAFRGGENQYFLNGRRVRLKDVTHLTASLGQSYTVVGQGLVDTALSQKAEERRGLFEHAADLAGLRLRVAEAERNLNEADTNVTRLRDLLVELEPRIKTLERQARQAREYQGLRDRQLFLQRGHYRRLLETATSRLTLAEGAIAGDQAQLEALQGALDDLLFQRLENQEALTAARDALASHDARLGTIRESLRRLGHERDLVAERQGAITRRLQDTHETQAAIDEQFAGVEAELTAARASLATLTAGVETARTGVRNLQAEVQADRKSRSDFEQQAADLARTIAQQERQLTDLAQQRALLEQKQETASTDAARVAQETQDRANRITQLETEVAAFAREDERIATEIAAFDKQLLDLAAQAEVQREGVIQAAAKLADLDRRLGQASNRLSVLQRLQDEGSGLHAGVRQVVQASREGKLQGIRGTVAELIKVDAQYDTAIEVALGGHLQDVVVERWANAETAIKLLKDSRAGRATFQPLDTLGRRGERPAPRELNLLQGSHGVASDIVQSDGDIAVVVRALLGRFVVVDDLAAAREAIRDLPTGWNAVTLSGEIARSGGSVTGGATVRESGALGRERDLRELPAEIRRYEQQWEVAKQVHGDVIAQGEKLQEDRARAQSGRAALVAQGRERNGQRDRLQNWLRDLRKQQETAERGTAAAGEVRARQLADLQAIEQRRQTTIAYLDDLRTRHEAVLTAATEQREKASDADRVLATAQQELATLEERLRAEQRRLSSITGQRQGMLEEKAVRDSRIASFEGEQIALTNQRQRLETELATLTETDRAASAGRAPLQETLTGLESVAATLEQQVEATRQGLVERERAMNQGSLAVERARSEAATIRQRITDDLGLAELDDLLTAEPGPNPEGWELGDDYEAVEKEISRLRDRLRRVGYAGDDVVEEYEREAAHVLHLTTQLDDVMHAAAAIRTLLADLNDTMQARFEETFEKVSHAFTESFTVLFGGGTARLVLTADDETGAPGGIDIVAQPPGKRLQNLALLSGGERSLTAVALLFAILRVNPTPFVLLDEVDAALDEANVVRFRDELRTLAAETQAIVITHNRGTVEIADTLYGVTMGNDGVSQMLSIRLGDLPLDDEIDIRDLPAVSTGVPIR
jgi:chromosome segregation protein